MQWGIIGVSGWGLKILLWIMDLRVSLSQSLMLQDSVIL